FLHPEKKLGKLVKVRGDEKGDLTVKLEPLGTISGRVRTEDGKPAPDLVVTPAPPSLFAFYRDYPIELLNNQQSERLPGRVIRWLPDSAETDAEGKFRIAGLLPGLKYRVTVKERGAGFAAIPSHWQEDIVVESGKTKELGNLKRVGER